MKQIVRIFSNSLGHIQIGGTTHSLFPDVVESIKEFWDEDEKSYMVHFEDTHKLLEVLDVVWVIWDYREIKH